MRGNMVGNARSDNRLGKAFRKWLSSTPQYPDIACFMDLVFSG
jgi:hypothetical protein